MAALPSNASLATKLSTGAISHDQTPSAKVYVALEEANGRSTEFTLRDRSVTLGEIGLGEDLIRRKQVHGPNGPLSTGHVSGE